MEVICANPLCEMSFQFKGGARHFARGQKHYCSRSCQNTTHGQAGTPKHKIWERTAKRAKENGTPFSLTVFDIPDIPAVCPVLGIQLIANTVAGPLDSSPSVDRIIPALGYVPGNIRIISNRANRLRGVATAAELALIAADAARLEVANA